MPDDPRFDQACFGPMFNARHPRERVPAAVLQATSDQDVIAGVRLAHRRGWPGVGPRRRTQLGRVERARRGAADRSRRDA